MSFSAPLQVRVEIQLKSGPEAGQRRFRLSERIELPAALFFRRELPLEGHGEGRVTFTLPDGWRVEAAALLTCDPERPEKGSVAELKGLPPNSIQAIRSYIEQRMQP